MYHALRSTAGETLLEVLIALVVLMLGAFGAVQLLATSTINVQIAKERAIATSLAREGIEAVRSIRDTNWLRYAGERRNCWNNYDGPMESPATCNPAPGATDKLRHQTAHTVDFDPTNYKWQLADQPGRLDLRDGEVATDGAYQLYLDPDVGLYRHDTTGEVSPFHREVFLEYLEDAGQTLAVATPTEANVLRVTTKVSWVDRGRVTDVILTELLTDYLGR